MKSWSSNQRLNMIEKTKKKIFVQHDVWLKNQYREQGKNFGCQRKENEILLWQLINKMLFVNAAVLSKKKRLTLGK